MNKEPNKSKNEPNNEEAKVLSDEELEGIVGGGFDVAVRVKDYAAITAEITAAIAGEGNAPISGK